MTYLAHVEACYARLVRALRLGPAEGRVVHNLVLLDLNGLEVKDIHGRQGVLSWHVLAGEMAGDHSISEMQQAVARLAEWGIVQVVGQTFSDPRLTGPSALRLTHHGRVCLGLAPDGRMGDREPDFGMADSWHVLHHANIEGLLVTCAERYGALGWNPIALATDANQMAYNCGRVAASMVWEGVAVVSGFGLSDTEQARILPELMYRTRGAGCPRVLLLSEPKVVRGVAVQTGATMEWAEPDLDARREGNDAFDRRITDMLLGEHAEGANVASVCGVPASQLARPKRVDVAFEDLLIPDSVATQVQQAILHAEYRLKVLPSKRRFAGKGGGYRLLLSGLPGTGKSMMAEALATRLDKSVVKLDLSSVLSKWLGETEQQIGRIFDLAEASNSVLVLDEAEALFRQRSSGGSSGSNAMMTAVAYLLTRLDRFHGVLVATTNRTQDIDDALYRRFDDFIILPVPDHGTRVSLWKRMLSHSLEQGEGFSEDDYQHLGRHFVITGGLIRGAAIRAGAWAHGDRDGLAMPYVLASLARELEKSDHPTTGVMHPRYREDVARLLNDRRYTVPK